MGTSPSSTRQFTGKSLTTKEGKTPLLLVHNVYVLVYRDTYTKTPKMDPAQLDVFKAVKEISGKTA